MGDSIMTEFDERRISKGSLSAVDDGVKQLVGISLSLSGLTNVDEEKSQSKDRPGLVRVRSSSAERVVYRRTHQTLSRSISDEPREHMNSIGKNLGSKRKGSDASECDSIPEMEPSDNKHDSYREAMVKSEPTTPNKKSVNGSPQSEAVYKAIDDGSFEKLTRCEDSPSVDWSENAKQGSHLWMDCPSGETCYKKDCVLGQRHGHRKKCSACHLTVHIECLQNIELSAQCKPTFREAGVRNYREQRKVLHHWIHKKRQDGRCKECTKSFTQRNFPFHSSKDVVAICCSWCQSAYHSKASCFQMDQIEEECTLGEFSNVLIPPSWIIKISRKLAFKSSVKKFSKKRSRRGAKRPPVDPSKFAASPDFKPFIIKPIPVINKKPLIVFVNPRSGGNQGVRLIQKFNFYLNPRQVFNLNDGGPRKGLELYKKVPNLHVLVCGGDGTAGWVLAEIDKVGFSAPPSVAVLPLGTGNDLARTLNWGSGYTDEPIAKVLQQIEDSEPVDLDRWDLSSTLTGTRDTSPSIEDKEVTDKLPISVMNNYFSLGADAHSLLGFHESREANPEKFNSRIKNKMAIAGAGGMDVLKRPWKSLTDHITLECDGEDLTAKIKELKIHSLLFLNIPKYSSGTTPWGSSSQFGSPRTDDGKIEVLGLSPTQLAALQVGGHGERIAQCNEVKITTRKTIPMQVDGEPCRLMPSIISVKLRNKARMLMKPKRNSSAQPSSLKDMNMNTNRMRLQVSRIGLKDYEKYHYDKEKLKKISIPLGMIVVQRDADLEFVRGQINRLGKEMLGPIISSDATKRSRGQAVDPEMESQGPLSFRPLASNWCFLDSATAPRFFRIDQGQENVHFITDISSEDLYILDPELQLQDPEPEITEPTELEKELRKLKTCASTVSEYKYPVTPPASPFVTSDSRLSLRSRLLLDFSKRGDLKRFCEAHQEGADMLSTDVGGMTVLHHAARFNNKDVCQYILQNAPLQLIDALDNERGQSALHKAAWYQRRTICRMLIQAGANVLLKDAQGMTPRELALKAQDVELANFLNYHEMLLLQTESASTEV
ncbi:diacylglycerol kinase zeta-like isoform X2 [Watersipora subatra]|uniref:diacylglycerol kinase zeta-like isoform X2 n=1 Tax=Watersipora subatra TaxID=2589382 RepID=UPI00355B7576